MATEHQWKISGWAENGVRPEAHEWECLNCWIVVNDGERADSEFCDCDHEHWEITSEERLSSKEVRVEVVCLNCDDEGAYIHDPTKDEDVEPYWEVR